MIHTPVLVDEIIQIFQPKNDNRLLDATLGTGGHAAAFLAASGPESTVVGIDADPQALEQARDQLSQYGSRVTYINTNFANLRRAISEAKTLSKVEGPKNALTGGGILTSKGKHQFSQILFDLGLGSHQLADTKRGFSFDSTSTLSMLYGKPEKLPISKIEAINSLTERLGYYPDAIDLLRGLTSDDLAEVIYVYGEERYSRRIAGAIKRTELITTATQLAEIIASSVPAPYKHGRINPATRTFQALRIAVNRELESLLVSLPQAVELLEADGIIAVISFHSLEDRIVKNFFRSCEQLEVLTKKPLVASQQAIQTNPRARSAKLRAAVRKNTSKQTHDTKHFTKRNTPSSQQA